MVKATIYQHRGQLTPVEIRIERTADYVRIDMKQDLGTVEISSDDPAWLEELEGAVRAAREHLERSGLKAVI